MVLILTFNPSIQVLKNDLSLGLCNSHRPCGGSEPISLLCIAVWLAHLTWKERQRLVGTKKGNRQSNHWLWNWCTVQQRVGIYNRLCIYHHLWPMMRHPISIRTPTLASGEMLHYSFSGTSLLAHHLQGICNNFHKILIISFIFAFLTNLHVTCFFHNDFFFFWVLILK